MYRMTKNLIAVLLMTLLVGCGADSGGDRAEGVEPGPPPSGGNPPDTPEPPETPEGTIDVAAITADDSAVSEMLAVELNSPLTLTFSLIVNDNLTVTGLTSANARFSLANLNPNPGSSKGMSWQSLIETSEDPICRSQSDIDDSNTQCSQFSTETDPALIPDEARKVQDPQAVGKVALPQATTENSGILSANDDGSWSYQFNQQVADAESEERVHRACIQFSINTSIANSCVDFVPAEVVAAANGSSGTSIEDDFYQLHHGRQIVTEQSCNSCHAELALHGGGRTQTDYCVTCHNPGSWDANSGNSIDFKQMIHKIHYGRELPSLSDGEPYKIWGFRNGEHDYSNTSYPQDMMTCGRCHAGDEDVEFANVQGSPMPEAVLTNDGHSWVTDPTKQACESCHEKLFTDNLKLNGNQPSTNHTSYTDERDCAGCHRDRGAEEPGGLQANQAHRDFVNEAGLALTLNIVDIQNTAAGEMPTVLFEVVDVMGQRVDLHDPESMCGEARFDIRAPYDAAADYRARISAGGSPADLTAVGDHVFAAVIASPMPAEVDTLAVTLDFNYPFECGDSSSPKVRLDAAVAYAASTADSATPRREVIDVAQCNDCHGRFLLTSQYHGGTRGVNSPGTCSACHNSEFATSDRTRELGLLVHGIHASAMREMPHKDWNTSKLQYPGELSDCSSCHVNDSYTLPLQLVREPIKSTSSTYVTATAGSCASCHDTELAKSHMVSAGGALFDVSFEEASMASESCDVCHGTGKSADVDLVHSR